MIDFADLKSVSKFFVVQNGPGVNDEIITDEKEFTDLQDAIQLVQKSQAPVRYLKFNHQGSEYKLYPIENSEEYQVVTNPILN